MGDRLFLALWPSDVVVGEIDAALPRRFDALRWQPASRWHLTVAFLGDRSPDTVLRRFSSLTVPSPTPVTVTGAGTFGPVLWLGVTTGAWLADLAGTARRVFDIDERRFRAHITVARARNSSGHRELPRAVDALAGFTSSPWTPTEVTLVRSTLGPRPAYEVMGRVALNTA